MNLKGRHFLTLKDFTRDEIYYFLSLAARLKAEKKAGVIKERLKGKNIALIFEKTSTRTRCSFEVAAHDLGMGSTYLDPSSSQFGKKESVKDSARVLGRLFDGIEYRGFQQSIVEEMAAYAGVPVWNGLTNECHPTQMLADFLTIQENFGEDLQGKKLVYFGDARYNMGNSYMIACAKMGMHFVACTNRKYFPDPVLVEECQEYARESGATITLTEDVEAVKGADVVCTDVWVSMGEPDHIWEERIRDLMPYQVTGEIMEMAGEDSIFLHCLPAFHDWDTKIGKEVGEKFGLKEMEVTNQVFESEQSKVFDEAENRMHTIKAVILATMTDVIED